MPFSRRTDHDSTPNTWTLATEARRARGETILDLTVSNPTVCDLPGMNGEHWRVASASVYRAEPFGLAEARAAVAAEYARAGVEVDPARVVLTASTSEAYSFLFKILGDAGDAITIPSPSYPLFDFLARGEELSTRTYPLLFDGRAFHYEAALVPDDDARAVIAVAPNHPTGSLLRPSFVHTLLERGTPLIVDEVFGRFDLDEPAPLSCSTRPPEQGLLFRLGGLSKQIGAPQAKLSWILIDGAADQVREALRRLELVADTFLSVSGPVQHALPALLADGERFRQAARARSAHNLAALRHAAIDAPCSVLRAPAGWVACVRVPSCDDELLAVTLLERHGVLVYPGQSFGFRFPALVLSLLAAPSVFERAAPLLCQFLGVEFGSPAAV